MTTAVSLREMNDHDCSIIPAAFRAQGWNKSREQFERYLAESAAGERRLLVAESDGEVAGYVTIVWSSKYPPFLEKTIPEIVDLNVLIKFRNRGIGDRLIEEAESVIAQRSPFAGIRVGLTADYAAAHELYIKRGYRLDGRGVSYEDSILEFGDTVSVDDNLALAMIKRISL